MQFEYILLLMISFFPLYYKFVYWGDVFLREKNIKSYIFSRGFGEDVYHFMLYLEVPLFLVSFSIFYNPPLEIFLFNMVFYFLLLYNVFVFGKICRRKMPHIKLIKIFLPFILLFSLGGIFLFFFEKGVYFFVLGGLLFMPIIFILAHYIFSFQRKN